jgi:hypothetical protein
VKIIKMLLRTWHAHIVTHLRGILTPALTLIASRSVLAQKSSFATSLMAGRNLHILQARTRLPSDTAIDKYSSHLLKKIAGAKTIKSRIDDENRQYGNCICAKL